MEIFRNQGVTIGEAPPGKLPPRQPLGKFKPHEVMSILRDSLWGIIGREMDIAKVMAQTIGNPSPVHSTLSQSVVSVLVGDEPCLFQFDQQGMPEQATDDLPFVAIGSGQLIADPFLAFLRRIYWPDTIPDIEQGVFSTVWALHHAIETNPGGVGMPIQIVTFAKDGGTWKAKEMPETQWTEHLGFIKSIETELATVPSKLQQAKAQAAPIPQPPPETKK